MAWEITQGLEYQKQQTNEAAGREERTARAEKHRDDEPNSTEQRPQVRLGTKMRDGEPSKRKMEEWKRGAENAEMKANAESLDDERLQEKRRTSASPERLSSPLVTGGDESSEVIAKVTSSHNFTITLFTLPFVHAR